LGIPGRCTVRNKQKRSLSGSGIGNTDTVNSNTIIRTIIAKLFLKYIWDSRCRYSLPTLEEAKENIISEIMAIKNASTAIRGHLNDSGLAGIFLTDG
jgi:hypothetical protein